MTTPLAKASWQNTYPPAPCGPPGCEGCLHQCAQVYRSQSSGCYQYLCTSFQVLGTCLIATGKAHGNNFTLDLEETLDPTALQPGILDSCKTLLSPSWESHSAPSGVPWPAKACPNSTNCIQHLPLKPQDLQNRSLGTRRRTSAASQVVEMQRKSMPQSSQLGTQRSIRSKPASQHKQNKGRRHGAKPVICVYIHM